VERDGVKQLTIFDLKSDRDLLIRRAQRDLSQRRYGEKEEWQEASYHRFILSALASKPCRKQDKR
jgi:hypothetical protein